MYNKCITHTAVFLKKFIFCKKNTFGTLNTEGIYIYLLS